MKYITLILLFVSGFAYTHDSHIEETVMRYRVIENVKDTSVAEGSCLVVGKAMLRKEPLPQGLVGTIDNLKTTPTDEDGKFSLLIAPADSMLYFFKPGYEEIITAKLEFKSQYRITIEFYSTERVNMIISAKPVIYLYSDRKQKVDVELNVHGTTTFTYPELKDSWSVQTSSSGILEDKNGNNYPYLFWEGSHESLAYTVEDGLLSNACQINTDTVVKFLEENLTRFGLNSKERTDFITYWGPKLTEKQYAVLQFHFDDEYSKKIASINVSPKPDASRRIYMMFSASDYYRYDVRTQEVEVKPFQRSGLTLVEWGGTNLKLPKDLF